MSNRRESKEVRELISAAVRLRQELLAPALEATARSRLKELEQLHPMHGTSQEFGSWLGQLIKEVSGAWIAVGLLLRLTEDFGLAPYSSGPEPGGSARDTASLAVADWLRKLAGLLLPPGASGALLELPETARGALLALFREEVDGTPRWRGAARAPFLMADLFSRLTEEAREHRSFIPTPDFVAEFLVERTLLPARHEFGPEKLQVLDPACGSGLLLEAAFRKLVEPRAQGPSRISAAAAQRCLGQLHGMDISPFACAWTRCTLLRALFQSVSSPEEIQLWELPLDVREGNALLEYAHPQYRQRYHVVLVEPPFTSERDPSLRQAYRAHFESARGGRFGLAPLFVELAFGLAVEDGFVGVLLSSSFMKREFGRPLVERVLARQDLTCVIDTSGAYLPGHGTPTVMLFARHRPPSSGRVRMVANRRGEPIKPSEPRQGKVWTELREHIDTPGFEGTFITVADLPHQDFRHHPWSLMPGDLREALAVLEGPRSVPLEAVVRRATTGTHALFAGILAEPDTFLRHRVPRKEVRAFVRGSALVDWSLAWDGEQAIPDLTHAQEPSLEALLFRSLGGLVGFLGPFSGSGTDGLADAVSRLFSRDLSYPGPHAVLGVLRVARRNHFCRLPPDGFFSSTVNRLELAWPRDEEERTLALLAYLNSSTAWRWLQNASSSMELGGFQEQYRRDLDARQMVFRLSPETLMRLPVPAAILEPGRVRQELAARARRLEQLARQHRECDPRAVLGESSGPGPGWGGKTRTSLLRALAWARHDEELLFQEMVVEQEELDWRVYSVLGLARIEPRGQARASPEHRPFAWLKEEAPAELSPELAAEWGARHRQRAESPLLQVFDAKASKRGWGARTGKRKKGERDYGRMLDACERWLLRRAEQAFREQDSPLAMSARQLAAALSLVPEVAAVAQVFEATSSPDLAGLFSSLLEREAVPFLAALRFSPRGLARYEGWKKLWELQCRRPVSVEEARQLAVPYELEDFQHSSYWRLRGRFDFPRERFISHPGLAPSGNEPLYGWAGWTLLQRAEALEALYQLGRKEGWTSKRLLSILQGLEELAPWVQLWHADEAPRLKEFLGRAHGEMGRD